MSDPTAVGSPRWAPDGSALYHAPNSGDGLRRVEVETSGTFAVGDSSALVTGVNVTGGDGTPLDLHPDGQRFVVARGSQGMAGRLLVVTNWFSELRERMGGR